MQFRGNVFIVGAMISAMPLAQAETLSPILVEDTVPINPNVSEPGGIDQSRVVVDDGGDFLRQINGVSGSRFGGRGIEPIIRGQSQTRLNVLLDGAYVHGGCPNRMDPPSSWAAVETYEKVIVMKGVQSLLYGGGGSGGTVLFERDTRALAEQKGVHGRVSGTTTDNGIKHDVIGDVVAAGDQGYVRAFAQSKSADNYKDGDGREVRSSFDHNQGGMVFGWTPTKDRMLEFTVERNESKDALYPGSGMDSPDETGDFYRLRYEDKPVADWLESIKFNAYRSDIDHLMDNYSLRTPPNYPAGTVKAGQPMLRATPTTSLTNGGRLILQSRAGSALWSYGVDLQRNERDAVLNNMDSGQPMALSYLWPGAEITQAGVFAEAVNELREDRRLKYGLRVDGVSASASKADDKPLMVTPNQAYQTYYGIRAEDKDETNVGGLLRYEADIDGGFTLFTGLSRTVRTADATERYMNNWNLVPASRWVGNPGLAPEKHHQLDLGLLKHGQSGKASAVVFYDAVSDYILRDTARGQDGILQSDGADIYRNVDAELWGLELDGNRKLTDDLGLSGAVAYVRGTNTTDGDRPIAQIPAANGKVQLDYRPSAWGFGGRVRFALAQNRIDEFSKQEVGKSAGWAVLDLYAHYRINKTFKLRAGVDNVLDKTYAEHINRTNLTDPFAVRVNEPGRTAWLQVSADF